MEEYYSWFKNVYLWLRLNINKKNGGTIKIGEGSLDSRICFCYIPRREGIAIRNLVYTIEYVPRAKWRRGWHKLKALVGTFTICDKIFINFFIKNGNSKCFIYIRNVNLLIRKKNYYIKEPADNVFSTCLCITIYRVMSASDEDQLRAFSFATRTGDFPTKNATNGQWWCSKSYSAAIVWQRTQRIGESRVPTTSSR